MDSISQLNAALAGRYAIEREIGRGGMATVYLARDFRHDRRVAVKVLNAELGAVLGVERFLSEIRVTATLQHPNLLPLFDSGEAGGLLFYVMPFVEGESLRARLEREKQLPVDDAVRIAVGVAGALDYAHRHGVIHRDLKPENILLHDGQPLVADFGIALAVSKAGAARVTQTGLSLGTPQYMSPEQATGDRELDARTDIYSLGAVTYEMLAGEPPHTGTSAQAIIAKLMTEEPRPLSVLRPAVPEQIEAAVRHALEKVPADRFASAKEFADALQGRMVVPPRRGFGAEASARPWKIAAGVSLAVAAAACVALAVVWRPGASGAPAVPTARLALTLGDSARLRASGSGVRLSISPDGSQLVYVGGGPLAPLYLRAFDDLEPHLVRGTENGVDPEFSPDGRWIAFTVDNVLKKVPVAGGASVTLADSARRASWGEGDVIVFERSTREGALWRVSASGGSAQAVTHVDTATERGHLWPHVLPGGEAVLFNIATATTADSMEIAAVRLDDRKIVHLGIYGSNPRYLSTGQLLFARADGTLRIAPFDAKRLRVTGPVATVLQDVIVRGGGAGEFTVSKNGTLVYLPSEGTGLQLVELDRAGITRVLLPELRRYGSPRYSPDGRRIAVEVGGATSVNPRLANNDLWIYEVSAGTLTRLTSNGRSVGPAWTADGRRVAWTVLDTTGLSVHWQPWDASGPEETLLDGVSGVQMPRMGGAFLTDSVTRGRGAGSHLQLVTLDATHKRTTIPNLPPRVSRPVISPDGQWLAYSSTPAALAEVFVEAVRGPGGRHQISVNGGSEPVWGPTGGELFYRAGGTLLSATITTTPQFMVTGRDTVFQMDAPSGLFEANYDVSRDGKHFVMPRLVGADWTPVVVFNWFDELRTRLSAEGRGE